MHKVIYLVVACGAVVAFSAGCDRDDPPPTTTVVVTIPIPPGTEPGNGTTPMPPTSPTSIPGSIPGSVPGSVPGSLPPLDQLLDE